MIEKRYQYYSKEGIVWTDWFYYCENDNKELPKWQIKNKLKNEYREINTYERS